MLLLLSLLFPVISGCGPQAGRFKNEPLPFTGDIIVIGSGIAALTAAQEAAHNGAAVILCYDELQDEGWMWREGFLAADDDGKREDLVDALIASGGGRGQVWHYELLTRRIGEDLIWLAGKTGVTLLPKGLYGVFPGNISFSQAQAHLIDKALDEGARFVEGAVPQELLIDDQGIAQGVTFLDSSGSFHTAYARAIILADGGYLNDEKQFQDLGPGFTVAARCCRGEGAGVRLARDAGIDMADEKSCCNALALEGEHGWVEVEPPPGTLLIIDERVFSLAQQAAGDTMQLLMDSAAGEGYLIAAEALLPPGFELDWPLYEGIDAFLESCQLQVPSLHRWFSQPDGNFYGCRVKAAASYCLGGIAVDETGTALRRGRPVEGLYAIGETAGGLNGSDLMPGTPLTEALVWGRYVGEKVAKSLLE